jgi:hypothetical protein
VGFAVGVKSSRVQIASDRSMIVLGFVTFEIVVVACFMISVCHCRTCFVLGSRELLSPLGVLIRFVDTRSRYSVRWMHFVVEPFRFCRRVTVEGLFVGFRLYGNTVSWRDVV